ncbi:ankyrin repeat domain-containing protein [Psychrosphaera ytuae]|uniref:Ankyrin repeat domain-containing protein n=1 Tax=Psychrosphaera ytuae TaxID=2820710 RepID=A0A975DCC1_9GAMM|nr:ankyrin repeat domain-containing protein [Psychrosphaera ytuae]QTH64537.1 ankyrin repeat domain-containing protein [Psychrosphaera ytuae]
MSEFPYPTHIETLRTFAKVLGVKAGNKYLDDKAKDKTADYRLIDEFSKEVFDYLSKTFGNEISAIFKQGFHGYLTEYMTHVSIISADGLSRTDIGLSLCKTLLSKHVVNTIDSALRLVSSKKPLSVVFFSYHETCTSQILNWLEENERGWESFYKSLEKENKAKVKAWKDGEHKPDVQSLVFLQSWSQGPWPEHIDWQKVRVLLFIASIIDRTAKEEGSSLLIDECRLFSWGAKPTYEFSQLIQSHQQDYKDRISYLLPLVEEIQQGLKRTIVKNEGQFEYFKTAIDKLEQQLSPEEHKSHFAYWVQWHKARMYVLNGQLEEANALYKLGFDGGLYRAGINQKYIIEEAIVVAASQEKPDKVFLKHLKNALLMFNYDIPSVQSCESSNKFSDIIEDWEVQIWRSSFYKVFPKAGMFPEAKTPEIAAKIGINVVTDIDEIKPDYRHPNRKLKIGETWKKTYPQLVWFAQMEKSDVVKKLLKQGANVNLTSSSGDTAILMALEALNLRAVPFRSLDDSLFNLLSEYPHSEETMNRCTDKKRLQPLISAVQSGRPDIVDKVLAMGANVNNRGLTDNQTALNACIKMIGIAKDPKRYWSSVLQMQLTPEVLDSIRRENSGMTGFTLEDQLQFLLTQNSNPKFRQMSHSLIGLMSEKLDTRIDIAKMRLIASQLIEVGADVNAEHVAPIKGYTPLMLAAELDEVDLFNKMLSNGGEPRKTYYVNNTGEDVDCWRIAEHFGSKDVLATLKDIEGYFPENISQCNYH